VSYAVRRFHPTRAISPRQLPTDHDCAVPTREYQSDQPSYLPLVLSPALRLQGATCETIKTSANVTLDRSLHIRTRCRNKPLANKPLASTF
jgi:hypothetical protein